MKMTRSFTIDYLRTFVAIADVGTFAAAADRVGRTVSAVSLQIDKLEEQAGQLLFEKSGRRMVLTPSGRDLLDHARTILAANDTAMAALTTERLSGIVRVGVLHDVLESTMAGVFATFTAQHPAARLEITVDTSRALVEALDRDELDQVIAFQVETRRPSERLAMVPMVWIGAETFLDRLPSPLPLVLLDEPCAFRRAALTALDNGGIAWRVVLTSASLAAVKTAVASGLGITARTQHFVDATQRVGRVLKQLPMLPEKQLLLYRRQDVLTSRTGLAFQAACREAFGTAAQSALKRGRKKTSYS
jgi:DNA-binding transcriptional LysR family regulator